MLALSDSQLRALWEAAAGLPIEKRGIFLLRLVAQLQFRSSNFTTADLDDAVRLALKGLMQKSAADGGPPLRPCCVVTDSAGQNPLP
jgi:hypothetical protein